MNAGIGHIKQTRNVTFSGDWGRLYSVLNNAVSGGFYRDLVQYFSSWGGWFQDQVSAAYASGGASLGLKYSPADATLRRRQYYPYGRTATGRAVRKTSTVAINVAAQRSFNVRGKLAKSIITQVNFNKENQEFSMSITPSPRLYYKYTPINAGGGANTPVSAQKLATWFEYGTPGGRIKARPIWGPIFVKFTRYAPRIIERDVRNMYMMRMKPGSV